MGGLPDDLHFELIEPVRELFKDEVRQLGRTLEMPDELIWRQPFPGPGLAIRIIGDAGGIDQDQRNGGERRHYTAISELAVYSD